MTRAAHAPLQEPVAASFLDSNVLLYLLSDQAEKIARTQQLLRTGPVISVQVLNEVTHVCRRKTGMPWADIQQFLALVRHFCKVVPLTEATHDEARRIAERYRYALYDASIIASASLAGCHTLFSEDLNDGQVLGQRLTIRNPYATLTPPAPPAARRTCKAGGGSAAPASDRGSR